MKNKSIPIVLALVSALLFTGPGVYASDAAQSNGKSRREQKKEEARARMDATMKSCSYRFVPSSMCQEPAGARIHLDGSLSDVVINGENIMISLPYIAGVIEGEPVIFNCNGPISDDYKAVRTDPDTWEVTFSTSNVGPEVYKLKLVINSQSSTAHLEIRCSEYPTVSYEGFVSSY